MSDALSISELVTKAHSTAREKGFWEWSRQPGTFHMLIGQKLALVHSEVSEALEALRAGEGLSEELADILIRTADLAGYLGFDLEQEVRDKLEANRLRPMRHGKAF